MNMKRDFSLKRRKEATLPPQKLYAILRRIYTKEQADQKYKELTGLEPPEGEPKGART